MKSSGSPSPFSSVRFIGICFGEFALLAWSLWSLGPADVAAEDIAHLHSDTSCFCSHDGLAFAGSSARASLPWKSLGCAQTFQDDVQCDSIGSIVHFLGWHNALWLFQARSFSKRRQHFSTARGQWCQWTWGEPSENLSCQSGPTVLCNSLSDVGLFCWIPAGSSARASLAWK